MKSRKQWCYGENVPPSDKNIVPDSLPYQTSARKPSPNVGTRLKSLLPPRPNLHNPLKKKKLVSDCHHDSDVSGSSSTPVKDELCRIKSTGNQVDPSAGYSAGLNAPRSLNVSKYSLHHPLIVPHVDADGDEEMEIVDGTEQATVPSNEDNKSTTPIERKDCADSVSEQAVNDKAIGLHNLETNDDNHDSLDQSEVSPTLKSPTPCVSPPLRTVQKLVIENTEQRFDVERAHWYESDSKRISIIEDLQRELEASRLLVEKQKHELETERKCSKELKDALEMVMEGRAQMLEQYADLEGKYINLLTSQRRIEDGSLDVKKAAAKAGVQNAESKVINALAAETSALKEEREKERLHYRDENKGLQAQSRDTAEAVQSASELLVRLKEAEEAVAAAEARAREAEQKKEKAYKEIESLKKKQENLASPPLYDIAMYDDDKEPTSDDPQWKNEFENFYNENGELTNLPVPCSWSSGYDTCNI